MDYFYETIEDCKKEILDKSINLDIAHAANANLFESIVCVIRTVFIWTSIGNCIVSFATNGFRVGIGTTGFAILIYIVATLIISWAKFNYNNAYEQMKMTLLENIVDKCKEFKEGEYEDWQRNQILKKLAAIANIKLEQ